MICPDAFRNKCCIFPDDEIKQKIGSSTMCNHFYTHEKEHRCHEENALCPPCVKEKNLFTESFIKEKEMII